SYFWKHDWEQNQSCPTRHPERVYTSSRQKAHFGEPITGPTRLPEREPDGATAGVPHDQLERSSVVRRDFVADVAADALARVEARELVAHRVCKIERWQVLGAEAVVLEVVNSNRVEPVGKVKEAA